jgi:3-ketosteroid 9alpha-monooxygenase subunit B
MDCVLTFTLDGSTHTVPMPAGQTVLEAAEAAGMQPPYSCRDGQCATCMCTLTAGSVHMAQNAVLTAADLADGWVLACQALATSATISVRWPD